jgi:hypothetical protein
LTVLTVSRPQDEKRQKELADDNMYWDPLTHPIMTLDSTKKARQVPTVPTRTPIKYARLFWGSQPPPLKRPVKKCAVVFV